jgi:hypothetical protein
LLGSFTRPKNHLREATSQCPVMVELCETQFLVGKVSKLIHGINDADVPYLYARK